MKTLIFDFDGTIADVMKSHMFFVNELAKELQLPEFSESEIQVLRGKTLPQLMKEYSISWFKLPFLIKKAKELQAQTRDILVPVQGMVETLVELHKKGVKMGILTSNSKDTVEYFLDKFKLAYFDFLISDSSIFGKDRKIKKLLNERNLMQEEVIYVGDEVRDVEACKKCGIPCVSVSWGLNSRELLVKNNPYKIIDKAEELLTLQLL